MFLQLYQSPEELHHPVKRHLTIMRHLKGCAVKALQESLSEENHIGPPRAALHHIQNDALIVLYIAVQKPHGR